MLLNCKSLDCLFPILQTYAGVNCYIKNQHFNELLKIKQSHVLEKVLSICKNQLIHTLSELEIAVGHWPFSDQFQDLADQN